MKIAIVVPYFTPYVRGNEYGLSSELSRLGHDVTILSSKGKAPREKMVMKSSMHIEGVNFKVKYLPTLLDIGEIPFTPTIFLEIMNGGYDTVLIQEDYQLICHIAYIAARIKGTPVVLSTERTYVPAGKKRFILKLFDATLNKMVRRGATAFTAHCTAAKRFVEKEFEVDEGRIKVINVGVDTGLFKPTEGDTPLKDGRFKILTVARLHPYKGLEYLIRAMAIVKEKYPGAMLYIMGRGPQENELKSLSKKLGVNDSVTFIDRPVPNQEMPKVYSSADVYAQPSIIEPYGIAVVEAMACQKPAICSSLGGMMDTVEDGVTGYLVEPADPEGIAEKIIMLAEDRDHLRLMGEEARKRAVEKFDWNVIAKQYLGLLESIMKLP